MQQTVGGWRLSFDDLTDASTESIVVPYARGAHFNLGQWIQEDPTVGGLTQHLPYPSMQTPTFRDMTLDAAKPSLHEDDAQVLSTVSGVHLVPTAVTKNQFSFRDAQGPARQYLNDVFAYDVALYPLQVDVFYRATPSTATITRIESTITTLRQRWMTQAWPANLRGAISDDVKEMSQYLRLYKEFPKSPHKSPTFLTRFNTLNAKNALLSRRVH